MRSIKKYINQYINKYKKISLDVKSSAYFMLCNLFQKGIAFISVPIFTRIMTTEEYGQFSVFQSWLQIFVIFSSWNMAYGVLNKALTKYEDHDNYISSIQFLYTINTILFALFYYFLKRVFGNFLGVTIEIELLTFFELLFTPALALFTVKSRFELRFVKAVILTIALTILNPALGILFVKFANEKGLARIYGYLIAQILICGPIYIYNFYVGKKIRIKKYWPFTIKFCLPLIPYFISTIVLNQSDKIMISEIVGNSYAGIYSIAYSVAMVLKILNESINASFVPWMYKKIRQSNLLEIRKNTNILIFFVYFLNLLIILLTPEIIKIVASEQYMEAIYIMPALTVSVCLMFSVSIFSNIEMYYEYNTIIMGVSVTISFINIILNYIFISSIGYLAAAYTTLFSYMFSLAWHAWYCKRKIVKISLFIDYKFLIVVNMFAVFFLLVVPILYKNIILRLFLLLITLLIIWKITKKIRLDFKR